MMELAPEDESKMDPALQAMATQVSNHKGIRLQDMKNCRIKVPAKKSQGGHKQAKTNWRSAKRTNTC
jgi:hypothetical protein